ncbi:MAG: aminotransferase class I/II-fold pyridoxal phosphate-dependent enzyme [Carboxylicivirga sp.]|jgi:threonine-phosphate decarboxylase|nr:aminotransferase class I/II-fold pyridoxal phosphate-dependent enzyme [Carboxylicivirga sp.]
MKVQASLKKKIGCFDHGNDGYRFHRKIKADFSTNTWYKGPHPELIELIRNEINDIATYPELHSESLTEKLADHHHLANDQVLVCNGTAEGIFYIAQAHKGVSSRIITPTFSEYEHACQTYQHQISFCGADFVSESLHTKTDIFWLCNPNNPTGQLFSKDLLSSLLNNNPQTLFVIDEAYADFCMEDISMIPFVGKYKNLLILKSLTKNHCLPGLRLGYILGHQQIIKELQKFRPPWSVNCLALKAGEYALNNPIINHEELIQHLALARQLKTELQNIDGIEVFPTSTGFFLLKTPMPAAHLKELLVEEYGLLIRDASNFRTLSEHHIRLASLSRENNKLLIDAFKTIFR